MIPLPLPPPLLTLSLVLLMFRTADTGRNASISFETVTNTVKHEKTCSFCQEPEYLHVVNHSAIPQLSRIKLTQ